MFRLRDLAPRVEHHAARSPVLRLADDLPFLVPRFDLVPLGDVSGADPLAGHRVAIPKREQDEDRRSVQWAGNRMTRLLARLLREL